MDRRSILGIAGPLSLHRVRPQFLQKCRTFVDFKWTAAASRFAQIPRHWSSCTRRVIDSSRAARIAFVCASRVTGTCRRVCNVFGRAPSFRVPAWRRRWSWDHREFSFSLYCASRVLSAVPRFYLWEERGGRQQFWVLVSFSVVCFQWKAWECLLVYSPSGEIQTFFFNV